MYVTDRILVVKDTVHRESAGCGGTHSVDHVNVSDKRVYNPKSTTTSRPTGGHWAKTGQIFQKNSLKLLKTIY